MQRLLTTALTLLVLFRCAAPYECAAQPEPRDNELQFTGTFFRPVGSGDGALNVDGLYSYHFDIPNWELGVRQSLVYDYNSQEKDTWNAVTAPFVNYNFLSLTHRPELVPFLGGLLGAVYNDKDFSGTTGPQGGVKWYVNSTTFLVATYRYEWFFQQLTNSDQSQDANHVVAVGIGYNWGAGRH